MSTPTGDTGSSTASARSAAPGHDADPPVSGTGSAHRTVAVILALIVTLALAYGLVQTGIKASALFTG